MILFPDVVGDKLTITPFVTSTTKRFGENAFQRYRKALYTRYTFDLGYDFASDADAVAFASHCIAVQGTTTNFGWFFWLNDFQWFWVTLGIGNGSKTTWDIPGRNTTAQTFFYGLNVALAVSSIHVGTGANGCDQVTFSSAPPAGSRVWTNFTGGRFFVVAFQQDSQPVNRVLDPDGRYTISTRLVQVK